MRTNAISWPVIHNSALQWKFDTEYPVCSEFVSCWTPYDLKGKYLWQTFSSWFRLSWDSYHIRIICSACFQQRKKRETSNGFCLSYVKHSILDLYVLTSVDCLIHFILFSSPSMSLWHLFKGLIISENSTEIMTKSHASEMSCIIVWSCTTCQTCC